MEEKNLLNPNFFNELQKFIEAEVMMQLQGYEKKRQEEDKWLTIAQVCDYIHITAPTVHAWSKSGTLRKHFISGQPRFKKSEIDNSFVELLSKNGGAYA